LIGQPFGYPVSSDGHKTGFEITIV
jgi:hypothetical protein